MNDSVEMGRKARPQAELGRDGTRSLLLGITLVLDNFFYNYQTLFDESFSKIKLLYPRENFTNLSSTL